MKSTKTFRIALSALMAAGFAAALPEVSHAQFDNSGLAAQRKQITDMQADINKLRQSMVRMKTKVASKFEGKEEWAAAQTGLKKAEAAYNGAVKPVMSKLHNSDDYKAAKDAQAKAAEKRDALQAKGSKVKDADLAKVQQAVIDAGLAIRKMETDAMGSDPRIASTKEKLDEAKREMDAMKDELNDEVESDPDYLAAQQELEQAEDALAQAKSSMAQQAAAARQAQQAQRESERSSRSGGGSRSSKRSGGR